MIKKIKYFLRKCFDCCPSECRDNVTEGAPGWRISQLTQETLVLVPQCGKLIHFNDSALHCQLGCTGSPEENAIGLKCSYLKV